MNKRAREASEHEKQKKQESERASAQEIRDKREGEWREQESKR